MKKWGLAQPNESTSREAARFEFAVPITIELSTGMFRTTDRIDGLLVELSSGGAAIIAPADERYKLKKRYRVFVDDQSGIIELKNLSPLEDGQARLGVRFHRLDLELQELIADTLDDARRHSSRLTDDVRDVSFTTGQ